jgi:hypothetical protein
VGVPETRSAADESPVFVVGPSRSGTSLLRAALNAHPEFWIIRETHYFDDLRPRLPGRGTLAVDGDDRERCERYFLALGHRAYGHQGDPSLSAVGRDELRSRAAALGGTGDAYFLAYCELRAEANGKPQWGEKTPRHVFRLDDIFAFRPHARVLCLVRDPRGVAASYRDWKRNPRGEADADMTEDRERASQSYNLVVNSLLWRSAMNASLAAAHRYGDGRVNLVRYEQLVRAPTDTLAAICGWLGVDYDPSMLEVPVEYSSYRIATSGVSDESRERWRKTLSPAEIRVVQSCTRRPMRALGYEPADVHAYPWQVGLAWAGLPFALLRATAANWSRLGRAGQYIWKRATLAVGRPSGR